jgi:hypothetical protein
VIDSVLLIAGVLTLIGTRGYMGGAELLAILLLFAYGAISFFVKNQKDSVWYTKLLLLIFIIQLTLVHQTAVQMQQRRDGEPHKHVHDHILQIEEASRFLMNGQNPYAMDYRGTTLEPWWPENPALDHVIALPFTILKTVPVMAVWEGFFGWYDDRITHLILLCLSVAALFTLFRKFEYKLIAIIAFCFNPLFADYFVDGRSDIIFLSFILMSLACLRYKWMQASLVLMAIAITSKHSAWFIVPFYGAYLWQTGYLRGRGLVQKLLPAALLVAAIVLPFALWDFGAFFADIYSYPAGTLSTSYPVSGYSLSAAFRTMEIPLHPLVPKILTLLLLPWLVWLIIYVKKLPSFGRIMIAYASLIFPFWLLSRFFHDNYMGVVVILLVLGILFIHDEPEDAAV